MTHLRVCIADGSGRYPKGLIVMWPEERPLPPGMAWFRELTFTPGPDGNPIPSWGDLTEAAQRIMDEVSKGGA